MSYLDRVVVRNTNNSNVGQLIQDSTKHAIDEKNK